MVNKIISINHPTGRLWKAGFEATGFDLEYTIKEGELWKEIDGALLINTLLELPQKLDTDPDAEKTGRINCILNRDKPVGYNTAPEAFRRTILEHTEIKNKNCVIIGAGKVARSIALAFSKEGGKITVLNRNVEKAEKLAKEYNCGFGPLSKLADLNDIDILINATNCGLYPNVKECPVPEQLIKADLCFDVIVNPIETKFLKAAKANR